MPFDPALCFLCVCVASGRVHSVSQGSEVQGQVGQALPGGSHPWPAVLTWPPAILQLVFSNVNQIILLCPLLMTAL